MVEGHPGDISVGLRDEVAENLQCMLTTRVIMLTVVDILLQRQRPRDVVNLRHVVPVQLQSAQELVEAQTRVTRNLGNADRLAWWLEGTGDDNAGDMVDRNHVDRENGEKTKRKSDRETDAKLAEYEPVNVP